MPTANLEQRYGPTSGTITGWIGLVACVLIAGGLAWGGADLRARGYAFAVAGAGVLVWSFALRPRIVVRLGTEVELRNPLSSWIIPIALVDDVLVRAITRVSAGGSTYDAVAVGRSVRQMVRAGRGGSAPDEPRKHGRTTPGMLIDLMTEQILGSAALARRDGTGAGPVRRTWAVLELGLLGACAVGAAVCLLV